MLDGACSSHRKREQPLASGLLLISATTAEVWLCVFYKGYPYNMLKYVTLNP